MSRWENGTCKTEQNFEVNLVWGGSMFAFIFSHIVRPLRAAIFSSACVWFEFQSGFNFIKRKSWTLLDVKPPLKAIQVCNVSLE